MALEIPTLNDGLQDTHRLYAWLSRDEDGIEGLIARPVISLRQVTVTPLVSSDRERALGHADWARVVARARRSPALLVVYTRTELIREIRT